jgi:hypothetical protein
MCQWASRSTQCIIWPGLRPVMRMSCAGSPQILPKTCGDRGKATCLLWGCKPHVRFMVTFKVSMAEWHCYSLSDSVRLGSRVGVSSSGASSSQVPQKSCRNRCTAEVFRPLPHLAELS